LHLIIIIIIIYLLHKSIQRTKYSDMNSGAGQQGKALTAAQKLAPSTYSRTSAIGAGFIFPLFKQLLARFCGLKYIFRFNCMKTNDV